MKRTQSKREDEFWVRKRSILENEDKDDWMMIIVEGVSVYQFICIYKMKA